MTLAFSTVENENSLSANITTTDSNLILVDTTKIEIESKNEVRLTWYGKCTYYADKYHGKLTASGAIFSQKKLTAAKSKFNKMNIPYGSKVRVTNLDNSKSVIVTINDNGPFKGQSTKNDLDLSKSAYLLINIKGKDLYNVKFEVLN